MLVPSDRRERRRVKANHSLCSSGTCGAQVNTPATCGCALRARQPREHGGNPTAQVRKRAPPFVLRSRMHASKAPYPPNHHQHQPPAVSERRDYLPRFPGDKPARRRQYQQKRARVSSSCSPAPPRSPPSRSAMPPWPRSPAPASKTWTSRGGRTNTRTTWAGPTP